MSNTTRLIIDMSDNNATMFRNPELSKTGRIILTIILFAYQLCLLLLSTYIRRIKIIHSIHKAKANMKFRKRHNKSLNSHYTKP